MKNLQFQIQWKLQMRRKIKGKLLTQITRDDSGTSPEGPLKVLTSKISRRPSGDSQGTNKKIDNLMKTVFFRYNSL